MSHVNVISQLHVDMEIESSEMKYPRVRKFYNI